MCFTPQVSFTIFFLEFVLGLIVLWKMPVGRYRMTYLLSSFILFFLGAYQFSQFMLCTTSNIDFWGKFGFVAYTFLPAMGIHFAYALTNRKHLSLFAVYIFPIFFGLMAILSKGFIVNATCSTVYIIVNHSWSIFWENFYGVYYTFFIVLTALVFLDAIRAEKNRQRKKIFKVGLTGILAFTIPTFILTTMFPALNIAFPSILCEFAVLFAIFLFYMLGLIEKSH